MLASLGHAPINTVTCLLIMNTLATQFGELAGSIQQICWHCNVCIHQELQTGLLCDGYLHLCALCPGLHLIATDVTALCCTACRCC
jgi:hypothetical protein